MLPSPMSILLMALLQSAPVVQPAPTAPICQNVQRIELSLTPGTYEICVSPGLLTGFVFDAPVVVDLQDEVRFMEVTRSRTSISIIPPVDMTPGERLRLTALFGDGSVQGRVTFILVGHSGRAAHQVEVYRDKRSRESFLHEVEQERARNQQLRNELERLQHRFEQLGIECGDPGGMRRLIASRAMTNNGISAQEFIKELSGYTESGLSVVRGVSYRSNYRVAVEVWLGNSSPEPWMAADAALVDASGMKLKGIRLWQESAIPATESRLVVVEADVGRKVPLGDITVVLRENGPRSISIPKVAVPQ
ncbi:DUF2381 family protein [Archangium lipolyticum]|uniref:DUF2381 family protein n=1 Tax=Archangium lipolyticum TaxID=2970465 RepID=UPI00214A1493|nr:DUF2381 family protein [Archangium lipolyticum]